MKRRLSARSVLSDEIFRLQQRAFYALPPEWKDQKVLPGATTHVDVAMLLDAIPYFAEAGEALDGIAAKLKDAEDRELLYSIAAALLRSASFVGSRALISNRQKSAFASARAAAAGRKSGKRRAKEADETWRAEVAKRALEYRRSQPAINNEQLADKIIKTWRLKIAVPKFRTITAYIPELERSGQLPRKQSRIP